jgi:glucose/arabinose dehydrogenase
MTRRAWALVAAIVAVLLAAGTALAWQFGLIFTSPSVAAGERVDVPDDAIETIATGLTAPWAVAFLPDGRAVLTERGGRLLVLTAAGIVSEQRLAAVQPGGEGGLLGVAVSPSYQTDRYVYVYYTAATDNRIARLRLGSGLPNEALQPIFTGIPKSNVHNGGRIAFGPDGLLYAGTGDASNGQQAQDRGSLAGKILRLTPDGKPAPGNPFPNSPVYSYGHRNVQGLAWDATGQLYATEFGQNRYDELNRIEPGRNYGWPTVEGMGSDPAFVNPVATWATSDASPSGLAIRDGQAYLACLRGQKLYRINLDGSDPAALLTGEFGRLRAAVVAPDNTLWVLTSNRDGRGDPITSDDRVLRLSF